ncbi:hypothetical protein, partial [Escherichia coli]|uniref:hypothetical protein n=1 Tax=Escherichia coli TaxID=562 RepID=UPI003F2414FA
SNHPPLSKITESEESLNGVLINYQVIVRLLVKMAIIIWLGKKIGWVKIYGRDYRVTSVVSPFFVCVLREICKANTHTEK